MPASLVAIPLFAGCCAGILLADSANSSLPLCAAAAGGLSLVAAVGYFLDDFGHGVAVAVAAGCLLSGICLGIVAISAAYRPDLLVWFDTADASTRESPVLIEGILREDAALAGAGVSVVVDVRAVVDHGYRSRRPTTGGVRLTVSGAAAPNLMMSTNL